MPKPVEKVRLDVKQVPGYSYPEPVHHVRIVERTTQGAGRCMQPAGDRRERVTPDGQKQCEGEGESDCPVKDCPAKE
jgi:hypothetical protein